MLNLKGKKAVIFGVANENSIAYGIAKSLYEQGVELAFTYVSENMKRRVEPLAEEMNARLCIECDVAKEYDVKRVFQQVHKEMGKIDILVHSIAFAYKEELNGPFTQITRRGFLTAMDISVFSLISLCREAMPYMQENSSIITLSYYGAEKVVTGYHVMGVAKAALENTVRYLAEELGEKQIRINGISAGPIKTLSAMAIPGFRNILKKIEKTAPLRRNVDIDDVGRTALFLLSDLSSGVTGEIIHTDAGYNIMGV